MLHVDELQSGCTYYLAGKKAIIPVVALFRDGKLVLRTAYKGRKNYYRKAVVRDNVIDDLWKSEGALAAQLLQFFEGRVAFLDNFLKYEDRFLNEALAKTKAKHKAEVEKAEQSLAQMLSVAAALRRKMLALGEGKPWFVIRSTVEKEYDTQEPLYWSNLDGWVDKESADLYSAEDTLTLNLVLNSEWVELLD